MGIMKDKKIEKILGEVIQLTKKVNDLCKKLKEEKVFIKFTINHTMSDPETISVTYASQKIDYININEKV
jgi:hypothetical protein